MFYFGPESVVATVIDLNKEYFSVIVVNYIEPSEFTTIIQDITSKVYTT